MPDRLLCERDTIRPDGTFDRAAILRIAQRRAAAERDLDVLVAAYGPTLRLPAGISQHNVAAWRRARAAAVDRRGLTLTPMRRLLGEELRRTWQVAHALHAAMLREKQAMDRAAAPLPEARSPAVTAAA